MIQSKGVAIDRHDISLQLDIQFQIYFERTVLLDTAMFGKS